MGCPSSVKLGKNLVFSICVHDIVEAILTDATSPPKFSVYKDLEHKPIHTGEMARLDPKNVNGLYATLLHCKPKFGFEANHNYTVFVQAEVNGDVSGVTYNFIVEGPRELMVV